MTLYDTLCTWLDIIGQTLERCLTQPSFECKLNSVNKLMEKLL
jgi:hypothetical protein